MDIIRTPFTEANGDHGDVISYTYPANTALGSGPVDIETKGWKRKTFDTVNGPLVLEKGQTIGVEIDGQFHMAAITGIRRSSLDIAYNTISHDGSTQARYEMFFPQGGGVIATEVPEYDGV